MMCRRRAGCRCLLFQTAGKTILASGGADAGTGVPVIRVGHPSCLEALQEHADTAISSMSPIPNVQRLIIVIFMAFLFKREINGVIENRVIRTKLAKHPVFSVLNPYL